MRAIGGRRLAVGVLIAVAVMAVVYLGVASRADEPGVVGLAPAGDRPFGEGEVLSGARRGLLNGDGTRLAVLTEEGLGLAQRGKIVPITEQGSHVVDAAWFGNGATLLVAEGPVPTGGLAVVDSNGKVRGSIPLAPSVGFGTGHGMTVAPGGRQAVVTAVERPALEAEQHFLVAVDLETGATRPLTDVGGPDESGPLYLDKTHVAYTEHSADGTTAVAIIDLDDADSAPRQVSEPGLTLVGAVNGEALVQDEQGRIVVARQPGRTLAKVPEGAAVTSIDGLGSSAVVSEVVDTPTGGRTGRLRRIDLDRIKVDD